MRSDGTSAICFINDVAAGVSARVQGGGRARAPADRAGGIIRRGATKRRGSGGVRKVGGRKGCAKQNACTAAVAAATI